MIYLNCHIIIFTLLQPTTVFFFRFPSENLGRIVHVYAFHRSTIFFFNPVYITCRYYIYVQFINSSAIGTIKMIDSCHHLIGGNT